MEQQVFQRFRDLIYRESGMALKPEKITLLSARIQKRIRDLALGSPGEYLEVIETDASRTELMLLLEAVSTNTTHFFRENDHFEFLNEWLDEWKKLKESKLRIWCAASSSGQEPYTISMCVLERLAGYRADFKLLATDISGKVLKIAMKGSYPQSEFAKVPKHLVNKYFERDPETSGNLQAKPELISPILYRRLNLNTVPYPVKGPVDLIFCRNVMIYFDNVMRQKVVDNFYEVLRPGGYLIVSHSESLLGIANRFERHTNSIFRK